MTTTAVSRRVSRDKDPLKHRRVRDANGREGRIESSWVGHHRDSKIGASVHWDDMDKPWHTERVQDLEDLELLDAPEIAADVYVRKVIFRGHKEQVAEFVAALKPLAPDLIEAGVCRYVEFDPQPAAYRRWRVVYQGPPMAPETVAATPDQAKGAESLRKSYRDHAYDEPNGYGF